MSSSASEVRNWLMHLSISNAQHVVGAQCQLKLEGEPSQLLTDELWGNSKPRGAGWLVRALSGALQSRDRMRQGLYEGFHC